jgi:hypothetical protein
MLRKASGQQTFDKLHIAATAVRTYLEAIQSFPVIVAMMAKRSGMLACCCCPAFAGSGAGLPRMSVLAPILVKVG